jgi:4'-phosphopantetheinyl transferase
VIGSAGRVTTLHATWADLGEVPRGDAWLTESEAAVQGGLRFVKRRQDWRVGRWVAKGAVSDCLGGVQVEDIAVLATEDGSPCVRIPGHDAGPLAVSLSHSQGRGFAVVTRGAMNLGCDLEALVPRSPAFIRDYFTESERAMVMAFEGSARDEAATLVWVAKEAALKATRQGLRADTRSVEVRVPDDAAVGEDWAPLTVALFSGRPLRGWLRRLDGFAWAVLADALAPTRILERRGTAGAAD